MKPRVSAATGEPVYCDVPPFHPDTRFPELPFNDVSPRPNPVYRLLRCALAELGLDRDGYSTPRWDPFASIIREGDTVVIKPNFVLHRNDGGGPLEAVVTHPSVLRAVADYAFIALKGHGRIIIADTPQMDCHWEELMKFERLDAIASFYRECLGFPLEVMDLRNFYVTDLSQRAYAGNRTSLPGDPMGTLKFDLSLLSAFQEIAGVETQFYGADCNREETIALHSGERHEYHVSRTLYSADVVISVPKMKVHKKVGVTLNLKGLVGTVTNKNCLVHYRLGTPSAGGDQLPNNRPSRDLQMVGLQRWLMDRTLARQSACGDYIYQTLRWLYHKLVRPFWKVSSETHSYDGGNWSGNDSAWRMTVDLAKLFFFLNKDGILGPEPARRFFSVVDGVVGGEGEGPLAPAPVRAGCIVAGENPVAVDLVAARLMGFDVRRIRQFGLIRLPEWDFGLRNPEDIEAVVDGVLLCGATLFDTSWMSPVPRFRPHPGWTGIIELSRTNPVAEEAGHKQ
jgi:uncharacterized protein (DUF362 family)